MIVYLNLCSGPGSPRKCSSCSVEQTVSMNPSAKSPLWFLVGGIFHTLGSYDVLSGDHFWFTIVRKCKLWRHFWSKGIVFIEYHIVYHLNCIRVTWPQRLEILWMWFTWEDILYVRWKTTKEKINEVLIITGWQVTFLIKAFQLCGSDQAFDIKNYLFSL